MYCRALIYVLIVHSAYCLQPTSCTTSEDCYNSTSANCRATPYSTIVVKCDDQDSQCSTDDERAFCTIDNLCMCSRYAPQEVKETVIDKCKWGSINCTSLKAFFVFGCLFFAIWLIWLCFRFRKDVLNFRDPDITVPRLCCWLTVPYLPFTYSRNGLPQIDAKV